MNFVWICNFQLHVIISYGTPCMPHSLQIPNAKLPKFVIREGVGGDFLPRC